MFIAFVPMYHTVWETISARIALLSPCSRFFKSFELFYDCMLPFADQANSADSQCDSEEFKASSKIGLLKLVSCASAAFALGTHEW